MRNSYSKPMLAALVFLLGVYDVYGAEWEEMKKIPVQIAPDFDLRTGLSPQNPAASPTMGLGKVVLGGPSRLAEAVVYQYGGPETRTRCIGQLRTKGIPSCQFRGFELYCDDNWISTCTQWATDFQQHAMYLVMYGPSDMDPGQVKKIKDACMLSAISVNMGGVTLVADSALQILTSRRPIMETTFRTCIQTTETLGKLVVNDFSLAIEEKNFW